MSERKQAEILRPYRPEAVKLPHKLTSPTVIRGILEANDLKFMKQFGQNFLTDENTVERIADAAGLGPQDTVLEVGPGIGTLTRALADRAGEVYAVEIDKKLIPVLENTLADLSNVGIINEDIMKLDFEDMLGDQLEEMEKRGGKLRIAANLPYYISTPVIMSFLESDLPFESMSFLVQKEVGERLAASPGSKAYGALSLAAQYYADVDVAFNVPATVFMPKPNVDSVVVTLTRKKEEGPENKTDKKTFMELVRAGFANRRKTLINSLKTNTSYPQEMLLAMLEKAGIDPKIRAEKLTAADFARMADALMELKADS